MTRHEKSKDKQSKSKNNGEFRVKHGRQQKHIGKSKSPIKKKRHTAKHLLEKKKISESCREIVTKDEQEKCLLAAAGNSKESNHSTESAEKISFVYPKSGNSFSFNSLREKLQSSLEISAKFSTEVNGKAPEQRQPEERSLDDILEKRKIESEKNKHSKPPSLRNSVEDAIRDRVGCRPRANSTDFELNLPQRGLCDERMILSYHRWKTRNICPKKPCGLRNVGNTCFMNATLQCLAYLPTLSQCLLDHYPEKKTSSTKKNMTFLLSTFIKGLYQSNHSTYKIITPPARHILSPKFRLGRQEDAHEFLVYCLNAMKESELFMAGLSLKKKQNFPPRLDETTFVHRIFGGYYRSQLRCTNCPYVSNTYDPFLDISLEILPYSCSLLDTLKDFTKREQLSKQNQWKCEKCLKYVCAFKELSIFRPPLTLIIQLKRFGFVNFGKKITKYIPYPSTLVLPLSDNRTCLYLLCAVIVHKGSSIHSGHYTSYVAADLHADDHDKNTKQQWYYCDDGFIQNVSSDKALKEKDAYMLFYCRKEVKLEFPLPPSTAHKSKKEKRNDQESVLGKIKSALQSNEDLPNSSIHQPAKEKLDIAKDKDDVNSRKPIHDVKDSPSSKEKKKKKKKKDKKEKEKEQSNSAVDNMDSSNLRSSTEVEQPPTKLQSSSETSVTQDPQFLLSSSIDTEACVTSEPRNEESKPQLPNVVESITDPQHIKHEDNKNSIVSSISPSQDFTIEVNLNNLQLHKHKARQNSTTNKGAEAETNTAQNQPTKRYNHLLGNSINIQQWGEPDEQLQINCDKQRLISNEVSNEERVKRKKAYLDTWDAALDKGKTKKVKGDKNDAPSTVPKYSRVEDNPFQQIQSGMKKKNPYLKPQHKKRASLDKRSKKRYSTNKQSKDNHKFKQARKSC